jgi:hypothetical protein
MYLNKLAKKFWRMCYILMMGLALLAGLYLLLQSEALTALASVEPHSLKTEPYPSSRPHIDSRSKTQLASQPITGVVIAPTDSYSYSTQVYTAPLDVSFVIISATAIWSNDWYTPSLTETTQSFPNIVEIPYQGGEGCDYIYDYATNNFMKLSLDENNQFSEDSQSIHIGPGKSVAIAGSDCGLHDNSHAHYRISWVATEQHSIYLPLVQK